MKKGVNLVNFTDLLSYATTIGYDWNQAHDILVNDNIPPMYECKKREYELIYLECSQNNDCQEYTFTEDSFKIVIGFMKSNKIKNMTVIDG